jgi:hypothetical protein
MLVPDFVITVSHVETASEYGGSSRTIAATVAFV